MSSRTQKKCRLALQVISLALILGACVSTPSVTESPHASVGIQAKTLKYNQSINEFAPVPLHSNILLRIIGEASFLAPGVEQAPKEPEDLENPSSFYGKYKATLQQPVAIGVRGSTLIVADGELDMVFRMNTTSGESVVLHNVAEQTGGEIGDIYIRKDRTFFLTDILERRVLYFTADGKLIRIFQDLPNMSRPQAIAFDEQAQELYVADEVYSHVVVFNMQGQAIRGMGGRGEEPGKFRFITDMIKVDEGFYISDRVEFSVQFLDASGQYQRHFGQKELVFPTALAIDKYGRLYVADKSESVIKVFEKDTLIDVIGSNGYGPGQFRFIADMKIQDDKLYVADTLNSRIQVFSVIPPATAALAVSP